MLSRILTRILQGLDVEVKGWNYYRDLV